MGKIGKPTAAVVADNVARILAHRGLDPAGAAKLLKVTTFQVNRLISANHSMTLRTLDRLAEAFGLEPYQLLVPGLDAGNPQVLRILSASEERLYKALEEARANGKR
jgi:predicted transcriptional regulator